MKTTEIVFEQDNKQVIKEGSKFFTRIFENGESFESGDFNSFERAKDNLGIQPTLEENNKIIAEFMGLSKNRHLYESPISGKYIEVLKYDTSWNWLMEVVEKIESLPNGRFKIEIYNNICRIYDHEEFDEIVELSEKTKIEATYNACVEFINWYNQQKN